MNRLIFAGLLLVVAMPLNSQTPLEFRPARDAISVTAQGTYESDPDTALIQFRIAAQEAQLKPAYDRASRAAEQVRQVLRENGIDPKQAEFGSFIVSPTYDWTKPTRKLIGYRVESEIRVKIRDFAKIGALMQRFTEMDVTADQTVTYILDDSEAAKTKALEAAFAKAKHRAQTIASLSGRALGDLVQANMTDEEQVQPLPGPMRMAMAAKEAAPAPNAEFAPAKITVTARVTAQFLLK